MQSAIQPAPEIPPDIVATLRLSETPQARHIGYWRDTEDGKSGYAHQALECAERYLAGFQKTGKAPYHTGSGPVDEAYLKERLGRAVRELEVARVLPWPGDHLDPSMPEAERNRQAEALFGHNASITTRYCSHTWDRLGWTAKSMPWECFSWTNGLGTGEVSLAGWCWPEGLFRYVQRYGLVLPVEFLGAVGVA